MAKTKPNFSFGEMKQIEISIMPFSGETYSRDDTQHSFPARLRLILFDRRIGRFWTFR